MKVIPDPDFDSFDGMYIGTKGQPEFMPYDLRALIAYARASKKEPSALTNEERERFRFSE